MNSIVITGTNSGIGFETDWVLVSSLDGQQLVNTGTASGLPLPRRSAAGLAVQARADFTNRIIATPETARSSGAELPRWFMTTTENPDRIML